MRVDPVGGVPSRPGPVLFARTSFGRQLSSQPVSPMLISYYYSEVILNDPTLTVDNPVSGHEIQVIVGSPSKVAKGTLIEFAKELTEHIRGNQRWSGVHVTVEPIELQDLPPLGEPRHIEGDLTAWILE